MTICLNASSEKLTLYYYGELAGDERRAFEAHLAMCPACAAALSELDVLRAALAPRAAATRTTDEWLGFMQRLDAALDAPDTLQVAERAAHRTPHIAPHTAPWHVARRRWLPVSLAALLVLAVALGLLWQRQVLGPAHTLVADAGATDAALGAAAARHFERAKLVVLGLAMKDPAQTRAEDWQYERHLAASLLPETRLFRMSATDRGDAGLASLLGDLESVLLQASMASDADAPELQRIQRVIRRRDLLVRMDLREL
jgi:hypothetical protein